MQIQRLTGPKSSFELTLDHPMLQMSKHTYVIHKWEHKGAHYKCTMFLEGARNPERKNQLIGQWVGALPMQFLEMEFYEKEPDNSDEELDLEVNVVNLHLVRELISEEIIGHLYERYIDRATHHYGLLSEAVDTNEDIN